MLLTVDKWPIGYGACSSECKAEGVYECEKRPLDLGLPPIEPIKLDLFLCIVETK